MSEHFHAKIRAIPRADQRYDTIGDWQFESDGLVVCVRELPDQRYEFLVAIHELVEAFLCRQHGITEESVTAFDMEFELRRAALLIDLDRQDSSSVPAGRRHEIENAEPGCDPRAPYREEHLVATTIERMLAAYLQVEWPDYERALSGWAFPP